MEQSHPEQKKKKITKLTRSRNFPQNSRKTRLLLPRERSSSSSDLTFKIYNYISFSERGEQSRVREAEKKGAGDGTQKSARHTVEGLTAAARRVAPLWSGP